jgi:hypothetical protein
MMDQETVRVLGQLIDYGYGTSAAKVNSGVSTMRGKLAGDELTLTYTTVFTYDKSKQDYLNQQLRALKMEAAEATDGFFGNVKQQFREMTGRTLRTEEVRRNDDVQMTSYNSMNTKATAYYRHYLVLRIES